MSDVHGAQLAFEVLLWGTPATLAARAACRAVPHTKAAWWLVASATGVIALDKALDLQAPAMNLGRALARAVDPESTNRGENQGVRMLLLGAAALTGVMVLLLLARKDRRLNGPKRLAILGLGLILALLAGRLMHGGEAFLHNPILAWTCELLAWGITMAGIIWGLRAGPGEPITIDEEELLPR